jgi:thymidylate synthase
MQSGMKNSRQEIILKDILDKGYWYTDKKRNVKCKQISSYTFTHDFKDGFPAITTKKLFWKGVVGELLWFLKGDTNIKYLVDNGINIWNKDAYNYYLKQYNLNNWQHNKLTLAEFIENIKKDNLKISGVTFYKLGDLGRIYGAQWRDWVGIKHWEDTHPTYVDQISNLIKNLKEQPMSRRHIVTAWNPAELDDMALPPCHWSFEILVEPLKDKCDCSESEAIDCGKPQAVGKCQQYGFTLKWHQRSVDSFLGKM